VIEDDFFCHQRLLEDRERRLLTPARLRCQVARTSINRRTDPAVFIVADNCA
jgi:hypothetical protein